MQESSGTLEQEAMGADWDNSGNWLREERLFCDNGGQALRETASCKMGGSWPRPSSLVFTLEREPVTQHKHRFIDWFLFDVDICLIMPHGGD